MASWPARQSEAPDFTDLMTRITDLVKNATEMGEYALNSGLDAVERQIQLTGESEDLRLQEIEDDVDFIKNIIVAVCVSIFVSELVAPFARKFWHYIVAKLPGRGGGGGGGGGGGSGFCRPENTPESTSTIITLPPPLQVETPVHDENPGGVIMENPGNRRNSL
jgi:hypothetical protein